MTGRKYNNVASNISNEEVFDKKGNKLFGLFKKVKPDRKCEDKTPEGESFDKNKIKLDWTYKSDIAALPKDDVYDRFGNKINGTLVLLKKFNLSNADLNFSQNQNINLKNKYSIFKLYSKYFKCKHNNGKK